MYFAHQPRDAGAELDAFVRRHQAEVWHYLRTCGCDHQTADDLTQETFVVLLRKAVSFPSAGRARSYLRRTARLLFLEALRRRRPTPVDPDNAWLDAVDASWESEQRGEAEWLTALRGCLRGLAERPRRVVEMFYRDQVPRAEIARRLELTENGIKTLLQRARADLRACMETKWT